MCYLVSHDKIQPDYEDDERSIGYSLITKHTTTEALEALGATLNFFDIWLKLLEENYDARRLEYITAMKEMSKQISITAIKAFTSKQKVQKLMIEIGGGWYMKKSAKVLPPLRRSTLSKKAQDKDDKIKNNYMKLISGGTIRDSNYIGTSLNG